MNWVRIALGQAIIYNAAKGGKRPSPFLLATWGSGGRRVESGRPDY
ncbi:hypothetical protein ACFLU9_00760 [Chloroflexota bacterium]